MQFLQRKFAVTSAIKIYTKMWELWVHPDYDHLYIPNNGNSSHKPTYFLGITTLFLLNLTLLCGPSFWKKYQVFPVWNIFTFFKLVEIMVSKYEFWYQYLRTHCKKKTATVHKLFEGSSVRFFGLLLKTYFKNSYFETSINDYL